jgi:hypothetical protein
MLFLRKASTIGESLNNWRKKKFKIKPSTIGEYLNNWRNI